MGRFYQTPGGRLISRGKRGRFRTTTMADVGMATCESCRKLFTPDYGSLGENPDPRAMRDLQKLCPTCTNNRQQID